MCALHCCPFFASSRPSLCVCSMKHFYLCRVNFQWIIDAALTAYSELKPLRSFLPTQNLIPWLFGRNYRTRNVGVLFWLSWWNICLKCGRPGFDPWVGRVPGEGKGYPFQYSSPWGHKSDTTERLSFTEMWMHLLLIATLLDGKHWMFGLLFHIH